MCQVRIYVCVSTYYVICCGVGASLFRLTLANLLPSGTILLLYTFPVPDHNESQMDRMHASMKTMH